MTISEVWNELTSTQQALMLAQTARILKSLFVCVKSTRRHSCRADFAELIQALHGAEYQHLPAASKACQQLAKHVSSY
jgi:hypothetical protein